jgi:hypothetical protein
MKLAMSQWKYSASNPQKVGAATSGVCYCPAGTLDSYLSACSKPEGHGYGKNNLLSHEQALKKSLPSWRHSANNTIQKKSKNISGAPYIDKTTPRTTAAPTALPTGGPSAAPTADPTPAVTSPPVDCVMSVWTSWGACTSADKICGGGVQRRERVATIEAQYGGEPCPATTLEFRQCQSTPCPAQCDDPAGWRGWSSCTRSCGTGVRVRHRHPPTQAPTPDTNSSGSGSSSSVDFSGCSSMQDNVCNIGPCPIDCLLSEWSIWTPCSAPCSGGVQVLNVLNTTLHTAPCSTGHTRRCIPRHVLSLLSLSLSLPLSISLFSLPLPLFFSRSFSLSLPLSLAYSFSLPFVQTRTRQVIKRSSNGGTDCPGYARDGARLCNTQECPLSCQWHWLAWNPCTRSCGFGTQLRYMAITRLPEGTGVQCPPPVSRTAMRVCSTEPCEAAATLELPREVRGAVDIQGFSSADWHVHSSGVLLIDAFSDALAVLLALPAFRNETAAELAGRMGAPFADAAVEVGGTGSPAVVTAGGVRIAAGADRVNISAITVQGAAADRRVRIAYTVAVPAANANDTLAAAMGEVGLEGEVTAKVRQLNGVVVTPAGGGGLAPGAQAAADGESTIMAGLLAHDMQQQLALSPDAASAGFTAVTPTITVPSDTTAAGPSTITVGAASSGSAGACMAGDWSAWSTCSNEGYECMEGVRERRRVRIRGTCDDAGASTNSSSSSLYEEANCGGLLEKGSIEKCPVHCDFHWGGWGPCTEECGAHGTQSRELVITVQPRYGGEPCPLVNTTMRLCKGKRDCNPVRDQSVRLAGGGCRSVAGFQLYANRSEDPSRMQILAAPVGVSRLSIDQATARAGGAVASYDGAVHELVQRCKAWCAANSTCVGFAVDRLPWSVTQMRRRLMGESTDKSTDEHEASVDESRRLVTAVASAMGNEPYNGRLLSSSVDELSCVYYTEPKFVLGFHARFVPYHDVYRKRCATAAPTSTPTTIPAASRDCTITPWSHLSGCSLPCDGGVRVRTRYVLQPAQGNGMPCPQLSDVHSCNTQHCPQHCQYTWSAWAECDRSCGWGVQSRNMSITRVAMYGGESCPTPPRVGVDGRQR